MVEDIPAIMAWPGGNGPELGFAAINPAHGSWYTHRATSIIAHRQRPHPSSYLGCGTSRRATWRTAQVPGIVSGAEHQIIRRELPPMIRGIGFRKNRTSCRSEPFDQDSI